MSSVRLTLVLSGIALLAQTYSTRALAWNSYKPNGGTECSPQSRWSTATPTGIRVVFSSVNPPSDSVAFTATEKSIVEGVIEQFNSLPNASVYLWEPSGVTCVGEDSQDNPGNVQPDNTICIMKKSGASGGSAKASSAGGCTPRWCEVELGATLASDKDYFWKLASQEIAHCLGMGHDNNVQDWMTSSLNQSSGGTGEHVAISRDTMNGLMYKYAFTQNFVFGEFTGDSKTDILVRDSSLQSNTVPWYLLSRSSTSWVNEGQVIADFGQETTLNWLSGDFSGDGCTDIATALCDNCDVSDGNADAVNWYVRPGDCAGGFDSSTSWIGDWGNGEDFDYYRAGDFDGNGCDDLWLIRDRGSDTCNGNLTDPNDSSSCRVEIWVSLAEKTGGVCDSFTAGGSGKKLTLAVSDRSAASAWPWIVGDFVEDDDGCKDMAYGVGSQSDPRVLTWYVLEAYDSDSDNECDSLRKFDNGAVWVDDFGQLGDRHFFAEDVGYDDLDDLVLVRIPVKSGQKRASWWMTYNSNNQFIDEEAVVVDNWIAGTEEHWTGKVFGVGNFNSTLNPDLIALTGDTTGDAVSFGLVFGTSLWPNWLEASNTTGTVPGSDAISTQPTIGGSNVRDLWWCETCAPW